MPPRLRPTRLEYVVDGIRLRAQLSAARLAHQDGASAVVERGVEQQSVLADRR